jgi:hypothetical protein
MEEPLWDAVEPLAEPSCKYFPIWSPLTFALDLRSSSWFLKPFPYLPIRTSEKSPSDTHSPPRPSQTPATSFNRPYRKSRHWP